MTTYRLVLPFPAPPMTMNQARRAHWTAQREAKEQVQRAVWALAKNAKIPRLERCVVALIWYAASKTHRDSDGLAVMAKAATDGLVSAGVLDDDDSTRVLATVLRVATGVKPARVELVVLAGEALAPFEGLLAA